MPDSQTSSFVSNIQLLKKVYAALNENDIPTMLKFFDQKAVHIEFEGTPSAGTYSGLDQLLEHISKARDTWDEGSCEPQKFVAEGEKIIVFVYVKVKVKHRTEMAEGNLADVFTFKGDKIIEMRTFATSQQAIDWARS